jgi:type II secretory pathway pseudopilin PulG
MQTKGFTLIELLIYIALTAVIFMVIVSFILTLTEVRAKVDVVSEVEYNARLVQDRLVDAMRHAEGINSGTSLFGTDPGVLSIDMVDAGVDPTVFSLTEDDGQVQLSEAGAGAVGLTTDTVEVTNFQFTNLTGLEDQGIIKAEFTVRYVNPGSDPLYDYEESFQTTLRIPLDD